MMMKGNKMSVLTPYTYDVQFSQPLTQSQIDYLNDCIQNIPCENDDECPEFSTNIELRKD